MQVVIANTRRPSRHQQAFHLECGTHLLKVGLGEPEKKASLPVFVQQALVLEQKKKKDDQPCIYDGGRRRVSCTSMVETDHVAQLCTLRIL